MSHLIIGDNGVDRVIFREYICVKPYPKSFIFPDIDYDKIDFHVILGFAHETYNEDGKGTGNFYADWDLDICGIQNVKDIKQKYPNVKVIISIGGRDIDRDTIYPFSPIEKDDWCENAVNSLKTIIQQNNFDGIDINYDYINTDEKDFSDYIGNVIFRLKKEVGIDVVSIAPSYETDKYYNLLYLAHPDNINWINFQFYRQPITFTTEDEIFELICSLSQKYDPKKFLAGASTDPRDAGNVSLDVFKIFINLVKRKKLSGIFIWNANDLEKIALAMLSNN